MTSIRLAVHSIMGLVMTLMLVTCNSRADDREAALAGSWYPGTKKGLASAVDSYLEEAGTVEVKGRPVGVVAPHAGYQYSGKAAGYAFRPLEGWNIKRVILMGPSHRYPLRGVSVDAFESYISPLGRVPVDKKACNALLKEKLFKWEPRASLNEHSLELEVPFLQTVLKDFELIPLVVGDLSEQEAVSVAQKLKKFVDDETVVVLSCDFTHYGMSFGYAPFKKDVRKNIEKLDRGAIDLILEKDSSALIKYIQRTGATIDGRNIFPIFLELLPEDAGGHLLKYYTSGDLAGGYSHSVSYAAILFTVEDSEK